MNNYGFLSLVPVFLAIVLAIKYKNVVVALFSSVLVGVLITVKWRPILGVTTMIEKYFFVQLTDSYNAGVLVLLVFIGGFIALMEKSGGATAFANKVAKIINDRRKVQLSAWAGGILIFFSDLGTPLIVGPIFEPLFDKLRVSREKLAWILDSTASPVAVLIPFIGWGVYIMGLIQKEFDILMITETDWSAFIKSIPFNLYSILAVTIVPIVAFTGYEFSAMAKAEKRTQDTGEKYWADSKPLRKSENVENPSSKPILIWLPLIVLLVTMVGILAPLGFPFKKVPGGAFRSALSTGYLFAGVLLIAMMVFYKVKTFEESFNIYLQGMSKMMYVSVILVLAWSLSSVSKELGTSAYIIEATKGNMPAYLLPATVFIIAAILSFSTGSSWGTFAILMPLVIPMAHAIGSPIHICIGAILAGGMFGDHCSPISDTTILSSSGAGCDHVDHVKTQLPYALLNGFVSVIGFIIAGITQSVIALFISIILSLVILLIASKIKGVKIKNMTLKEAESLNR
ncbi:Na+/H+ antiporter NhaC family protein [Clostridium sp.]|uniref:Na+/H+ antiporter NhaC family protein n=1 Tax=Clostridium sp. TaxID=1506 RepID=UPI001A403422|nr:Na+/H+ antiporter NhaC family protein [Clostridium sp.]MBK5242304.1 Na+/H+ antiporter NhaC family protein [Clostridium sp.]